MCLDFYRSPGSQLLACGKKLDGRNLRVRLSEHGFMLVELIAAMAILLVLATIALPMARIQIVRARETELRRDLRQIREAIDRYKAFADQGLIPGKANADTYGYPPDLKSLVEGVPIKGNATLKYKFLRKVPIDPMTGTTDWGFRSVQDDPDSRGWGGQNVFNVYSKSGGVALDETHYEDW